MGKFIDSSTYMVLNKKIQTAIARVLMEEYPDVTVRFRELTLTTTPLQPQGWDLLIKGAAQVSLLDKKEETSN